ncbi:MAG: helix-turn-helix transcriptional regulator [Thermoleophilia bacterium]|nr:helix-turn-helix transcriptional regulator [Thermoleophilia bacterium]
MAYEGTGDPKLGARIARLRVRRGWSRRELAELAGVSGRFIQFVEDGERGIAVARFAAIASALGVSLDALYWGSVSGD